MPDASDHRERQRVRVVSGAQSETAGRVIPIINTSVPIVSTRNREVWTYSSKRLLDRLAKMLFTANVHLKLECASPVCPSHRIELLEDATAPLGRVFRCGCTDRHIEPKGTH